MIGGVLMGLLFGKMGYYLVLGWCCVSIFVFMVSWGPQGSLSRWHSESLGLSPIAKQTLMADPACGSGGVVTARV